MTELLTLFDTVNSVLLEAAGAPWVLAALALFCLVDGVFPPVPSESLVVALAALGAATGEPLVWAVAVAAAAGAIVGDNLAFFVGRRVGTQRFRWMRRPRVATAIERAGVTLQRRSASFILTARYVPVGRVAVNLAAGASGMPHRRYLPLSILAGLSWAVFSVTVGVIAGHWVADNPLLGMTLAISIALVLGLLVDRTTQWVSARRARTGPVPEVAGDGVAVAEIGAAPTLADCSGRGTLER